MTAGAGLPIILLTGFLGSGKTTILRRLLESPAAADTALVVNEIGEIGLDHHLLWTSTETTLVLENGCVCCSLRDDLVQTLSDLFWQRLRREIPPFQRVIVETTGLADPRHIIAALREDQLVAERFRLQAVVTTIDAVMADQQRGFHAEWAAQVSLADLLVLTKTDLAPPDRLAAVEQALREVNPLAIMQLSARGEVAPEIILGANRLAMALRPAPRLGPHLRPVDSFVVRFDAAVDWPVLDAALHVLAESHGQDRLLRAKGVVQCRDEPLPMLVETVGTMVSAPQRLVDWRGPPPGWMVFITARLLRDTILDVIRQVAPVTLRTNGEPDGN